MHPNQHKASNYINETGCKVTIDDYLVEDSPYFSQERNKEEIEGLMMKYNYVTVSDIEIACLRSDCDKSYGHNTLSRGDSLEIILAKKLKGVYKGLVDPNDEETSKSSLTASSEQAIMKPVIETAMYSEGNTYYFISK